MFDETGGGGQVLTAAESTLLAATLECARTAESLEAKLTTMRNNLAPMQTALRGHGGGAYQRAEQGIRDQMVILNNAMYEIGDKVGVARNLYQRGDEDIADLLVAAGAEASDIQTVLGGSA